MIPSMPRNSPLLDLDKLDPGLMYLQILALAQTVRTLHAAATSANSSRRLSIWLWTEVPFEARWTQAIPLATRLGYG